MPGAISRKSRISKKRPERSLAQITAIGNFARVTKVKSIADAIPEKKQAEAVTFEEAQPAQAPAPARPSRKRRATSPAPGSDEETVQPSNESPTKPLAAPIKRLCRRSGTAAQQLLAPAFEAQAKADDASSEASCSPATEQAEFLFKRLDIQSPRPKKPRKLATPVAAALPSRLQDLVDLHAAFLKTIALHFAHNGVNGPVDVREICPSISQAWGKRGVTVDDIRQCIGIMGAPSEPAGESRKKSSSPFKLSDYGRGRICLEFRDGSQQSILNEAKMNGDFEAALRTLWCDYEERECTTRDVVEDFITQLPKAEITPWRPALRTLPNLLDARRTLEELKNGMIKKQQQQKTVATTKNESAPLLNENGEKMDLLDRIRFRQLQQSVAASPPTPQELQRRAALHRVDDVAAVIGMLATASRAAGQARVSFTMATVLLKLRDSLRLPVSQEDGAACVRLLAGEIAPQWLRVVVVSGRENVVIQSEFQPSKTVLQEKVKAIMV